MVQINVKLDGSKAITMEVALSDKVSDVVRRVPNSVCGSKCDVYLMCEEKVLRRIDELRNCGIRDGSAVQVSRVAREAAEGTRTRKRRRRKSRAKSYQNRHNDRRLSLSRR